MSRAQRHPFGLLLASLAIWAQLISARIVPAAMISLADTTVLCQHDSGPGAPHKQVPVPAECAFCLFCSGAVGIAGLLTPPPSLPAPLILPAFRRNARPPAIAPPVVLVLAALPRGPPIAT